MLNRQSIASLLLAINCFTGIAPALATPQSGSATNSGLQQLKAAYQAQAGSYQAMNKFLLDQLPDYYTSNLKKARQSASNQQFGGEILDFSSMSLDQGKMNLVFAQGDPKEIHVQYRTLYKLDPADTESEEYKKQIYAIQLAQMMYNYDFKGQSPAEAAVFDLNRLYGYQKLKSSKPNSSVVKTNLKSPVSATNSSAQDKVEKFFQALPEFYSSNIESQKSKSNYGSETELSIVFQTGYTGDRLMGLYKIYGIDQPYVHFGLDMNVLRKNNPSQLDKKNQEYFYKLQLVSALYLFDSKGVQIDSKYCPDIKQFFGRDCDSKKINSPPTTPATSVQSQSTADQEIEQFVTKQLDLFASSQVFEDLNKRLSNAGYTTLNTRKWLYTVLPYNKVANAGLSESQYEQLLDRLEKKANDQLDTNKSQENWLNIPGQFVNGTWSNLASIPMGLVNFGSSAYRTFSGNGSDQDKSALAQGGASIVSAVGGCAAGGAAAGAVGSVVPFFGTAAGGVVGCVVGAFGAKTATNYTFASIQKGGMFNPFEPGNNNILCGQSEASFAQCAGYIATELGTEAITYSKAKVILKPLDDLKTRTGSKGNTLKACADFQSSELSIFDPDQIGNLSDGGNPLEYDSDAGRCNKYSLAQEGIDTKIQGMSGNYNVKLILKNTDSVKATLDKGLDKASKQEFNDKIELSKEKFPHTVKYQYGNFQFDHVIPVHQMINNLVKRGLTTDQATSLIAEATAKIADKAQIASSSIDVNSPKFTRFISQQLNLHYKVQVDKSFGTKIPQGTTPTADLLIEILQESNTAVRNLSTQNPNNIGGIYTVPYNITNTSSLLQP